MVAFQTAFAVNGRKFVCRRKPIRCPLQHVVKRFEAGADRLERVHLHAAADHVPDRADQRVLIGLFNLYEGRIVVFVRVLTAQRPAAMMATPTRSLGFGTGAAGDKIDRHDRKCR